MELVCGIYCIRNVITGRLWIGQSVNIIKRWSWHKSVLKNQKHTSEEMQKDYNIYGIESFEFAILEECGYFELGDKEKYYLDIYRDVVYNNPNWVQYRKPIDEERKLIGFQNRSKSQSGEKNPRARLTPAQVEYIKWALKYGKFTNQSQLANLFGIKPAQISRINTGLRWKKVS